MNLEIIAGYREYLVPTAVPRESLEAILRASGADVSIPMIPWAPGSPKSCYADFALHDQRTAELMIEYLDDVHGDDEHVAIIVPAVSWAGLKEDSTTAVETLFDLAGAFLGRERVRVKYLAISDNTQNVLSQLRGMFGECPKQNEKPIQHVVPVLPGDTLPTQLLQNYSGAVLELCEQSVSNDAIFSGVNRAPFIARVMARNGLFIQPHIGVERIAQQLVPGGEIHSLLTRPV